MLKKYNHIINIKINPDFPIKELRSAMRSNVYLFIASTKTLIESKHFYFTKLLKKKISVFL